MIKKVWLFVAVVLIVSFAIGASVNAEGVSFSDVDDAVTHHKGIEYLTGGGIVNGYPDGTFMPGQILNRAEMLKIVAEGKAVYEGLNANMFDSFADDVCFDDVPANEWYTKYVCYAKDAGWVVGYENGRYFRPSQDVTFVEGLKMTLMAMNIVFTEDGDVWYRNAVETASDANYIPRTIRGFHNGLQRAEMADMMARIINEKEGTLDEYFAGELWEKVTFESIEAGTLVGPLAIEDPFAGDSFFDLSTVAVGDEVAGLTVTSVSPTNEELEYGEWNSTVLFSGELTLTGTPVHYGEDEPFFSNMVCFNPLESEYNKIPRPVNDVGEPWFCFTNPEDVAAVIPEGVDGTFDIVVNNYKVVMLESEVWDEADFVRLVEESADDTGDDEADLLELITVNLNEMNGSGQSGTAIISQYIYQDLLVQIDITGGDTSVTQPGHIHFGTCDDIGVPFKPLENLVSGESDSVLPITMDNLKDNLPLVINIHKSDAEMSVSNLCGEIVF